MISLKSADEVDSAGIIARSIELSNISYSLDMNETGKNKQYNYTTMLKNGALLKVIVSYVDRESLMKKKKKKKKKKK